MIGNVFDFNKGRWLRAGGFRIDRDVAEGYIQAAGALRIEVHLTVTVRFPAGVKESIPCIIKFYNPFFLEENSFELDRFVKTYPKSVKGELTEIDFSSGLTMEWTATNCPRSFIKLPKEAVLLRPLTTIAKDRTSSEAPISFASLEEALQSLQGQDAQAKDAAIEWLAKNGKVEHLSPALQDKDPYIRAKAVHWIGVKGETSLLLPALKDTESQVRVIATKRIGEKGKIEDITFMLSDESPEVRLAAVEWISKRGNISLLEPLLFDKDKSVREEARRRLEESTRKLSTTPTCKEDALNGLQSPLYEIRKAAVAWLGEHDVIEPLTESLKDQNGYVKAEATHWIGQKGDVNLLVPLLKDAFSLVRAEAALWIGKRGDVKLIIPLLKDANNSVRELTKKLIERAWKMTLDDNQIEKLLNNQHPEEEKK